MKVNFILKIIFVSLLLLNTLGCTKKTEINTHEVLNEKPISDTSVSDPDNSKSAPDNVITFLDNSELFVISGNGLNLRTEPSITSRIVKTLPFGYKVIVISKSEEISIINNISSYWYQVQSENGIGWAFGGYLSPISNNSDMLIGDWQTELDYYRFYQDGSFRGGRKYSGYSEDGKWFLNNSDSLYLYGWGGWADEIDFNDIVYQTYEKKIFFIDDNSFSFFESPGFDMIYIREPLSYSETGLSPIE